MAVDGIIRAIERQAADEAARIERDALERAAQVRDQARDRAERETERYVAERSDREERLASRRLHSAEIAKNRAIADVRLQVFEELFRRAFDDLATMRSRGPEYERTLGALIGDAAAGLEGACTIHVDPADERLATSLAAARGLKATVIGDLATIGGASVSSCDGRITNDNTFESRLTQVRESCSQRIWEILES